MSVELEKIEPFKPKKRAVSASNLANKNFNTVTFDGEWADGIGKIVLLCGIWFIWGQSGNGKTTGSLALAKYLTKFEKVGYDSLEEGASLTFKLAIIDSGISSVGNRFVIYDREDFESLKERMRSRRCPKIIFIDSFQYTGLSKKAFIEFKNEFASKYLIIFVSHAEGNQPEGKTAKFVRYDADVKLHCQGHTFQIQSRYRGNKPVVINKELADKYWNMPA